MIEPKPRDRELKNEVRLACITLSDKTKRRPIGETNNADEEFTVKLGTSNDILTSRGELSVPAEVMNQFTLSALVDRHFPQLGSNLGYLASDYVNTFVVMLNEGGQCLDDVRHPKEEFQLLSLLGLGMIPSADALSD